VLDWRRAPAYHQGVKVVCLALLVLLSAANTRAQSAFIQGSGGMDARRMSGEAGSSPFDGTPLAFTVAVGGHIMPHWTLSAELDVGGRSTTTTTTTVAISGQPRDIHNNYTAERRGVSALAGYATALHKRVQLAYYAGLSFSIFRREIASDAESVVLQAQAPGSVYTDRLTGPILGVDAAIHVGPRFSVVPSLRVQGLSLDGDLGGHSIRPSIGARISF
jgi:hypothetical protein